MLRAWIVLAAAVVLLAGCGRAPLEREADQAARSFFAALQRGDWAGVDAVLAPAVAANPGHLKPLEQARGAIPGGQPEPGRTVGWSRAERKGHKVTAAAQLYRYPAADLVVTTEMERIPPDNGFKVVGFYLNRVPPGVIGRNAFTLSGKTPRHYGFLAAAVMSPLVMLAVALMAAFTPGLTLKPVWVAFCFVGVGLAWLNWTTGQGGFSWAQVGLINAGYSRATDISPIVLKFSAPLGAVIVLLRLMLRKPAAA